MVLVKTGCKARLHKYFNPVANGEEKVYGGKEKMQCLCEEGILLPEGNQLITMRSGMYFKENYEA